MCDSVDKGFTYDVLLLTCDFLKITNLEKQKENSKHTTLNTQTFHVKVENHSEIKFTSNEITLLSKDLQYN
jgi:hypothetical protein